MTRTYIFNADVVMIFIKLSMILKKRNMTRCSVCTSILKKNIVATPIEEIIKMVKSFNYKYIDNDLSGGDQKILIQCDKNHDSYWVRVSKFKSGQRCPYCNSSLGEKIIRNYLIDNNIKYIREYSFKDLIGIGGGLLRFDFAIFNQDNLLYLIEYDGPHHYKLSFNDELQFKRIQIHDRLKNNYCYKNNIKLIRIPYWDFDNISTILLENII